MDRHSNPDSITRTVGDHDRLTAERVARWGRNSVSPFLVEPPNVLIRAGEGATGCRLVRNWAVFATDIAAPPGCEGEALDQLLVQVAEFGKRPIFVAVADPAPYRDRGMHSVPIADDPRLELASFSLAGKRMSNLRHSVSSARRVGLRVVPYDLSVEAGVEHASSEWLATKRGGELGFTLGAFDAEMLARVDCRVALDRAGRVVAFVTWRPFDDGRGRVLDMMRRVTDAPNPAIDLLVAEGLSEFAATGVEVASLGSVPRSHGRLGERVYPASSLRRYKEKFAPTWLPLELVTPSRAALPGALRAVAAAFCPDGLTSALRRNR
ncbi:MAG: DUF2156 domain-containing protein [Acidimicrobiia bacterium]